MSNEAKLLSYRASLRPTTYEGVPKEEWDALLQPFSAAARWRVANMAAHGWTVYLVGTSRLLICSSSGGGYWVDLEGNRQMLTEAEDRLLYPPVDLSKVTPQERRSLAYREGSRHHHRVSPEGLAALMEAAHV